MRMKCTGVLSVAIISVFFVGCTTDEQEAIDLVDDPFVDRQSEIRAAVLSIKSDVEASNPVGLRALHLNSAKFTKFGPRDFERQDVTSTNESEAAFFGSITNAEYEIQDLKIDVFGDIGIATYYPQVRFMRDGHEVQVSGRQTLVFLKTGSDWKLVHEHGTARSP